MTESSDPAFQEHLAALRRALKRARDERGACPPWEELRDDLLPGGGKRPGRGERLTHLEACPYCDAHRREWEKSFDRTADALAAVERGIVTGLAGGAKGIVQRLAKARSRERAPAPAPPTAGAAPAAPPSSAPTAPAPPATYLVGPPGQANPPAMPAAFAPAPMPGGAAPQRILVVEMADRRTPPESVFLCAAVLEAEVAIVDDVRELANDPDLVLVCGIVLGGVRPPADWPTAVRAARDLAPGRPVVLLTAFGAEPTKGARRALGDSLIGEDEPAERLLLALDRTLR
jgi:hypothetical protein